MHESWKLAREFSEALSSEAAPSAELEAQLQQIVEAARAAWPVDVPAEAFVRHLASKVEGDPQEALRTLQTGELYLAAGCLLGIAAALEAFEARFFSGIEVVVRRARTEKVDLDDVRQMVREKLFVEKKIASYSGKGDLRGWFRVVVTRTLLNLAMRAPKDGPAKEDEEAALVNLPAAEGSELDYIRSHYAEEVRAVFPAAFARLTVKERLLLRQRYLDGLTHDEMTALHGVHRATIKRQLIGARQTLTDALRELLKERLGVDSGEFESILRMMRSRFHITVRRLLVTNPGP
jgi:RNA polymerase sigma-70 factor (ECF subfamily)